ncbi:SIMPL domain-containing protein, partial [Pontiellaceae bacterium B12227]|nr:SIMPL domain-containing protein [Pontiellaceae bacterium B12227]
NHYNETASNAVAVVESVGGQLLKTLSEKYSIPTSAITARDINKTPTHRRGDNYEGLEIMGYTVSRKVSVEISEIGSFPGVMRYIAELDNVTQVQAEFTSTQKEAVSRALTGEACR